MSEGVNERLKHSLDCYFGVIDIGFLSKVHSGMGFIDKLIPSAILIMDSRCLATMVSPAVLPENYLSLI